MLKHFGICALVVWTCLASLYAQHITVRGQVEVVGKHGARKNLPSTVVWLVPAADTSNEIPKSVPNQSGTLRLVQKNKNFEPHILVVPVGSVVEFPNRDPFFHNVFSLFEGKRFDLGLYEAGTSRMVHFDRLGISYIFCNIHPEMSAVVITLTTPLYAIASASGQISIPDVAYGNYELHVWSEHGIPETSRTAKRKVIISASAASLGVISVPASNGKTLAHKNKYGRDYDSPTPDNPAYSQQ
jgi:plastocyanin